MNTSKHTRRRHFLDRYYNDPKHQKEGRQRSAGRQAIQILRKFLDMETPVEVPLREARQLLAEYDTYANSNPTPRTAALGLPSHGGSSHPHLGSQS